MTRPAMSMGRLAICLALALGWLATARIVIGESEFVSPDRWAARLSLEFLLSGPAWAVLSLALLTFLTLFARRIHEAFSGATACVLIGLGTLVERGLQVDPSPPGFGKMLPAAVVIAWLCGWIAWRSLPLAEREARSHELACGVAAACLIAPGISKLLASGLTWTDGQAHALLIYERSYLARLDWITALRTWIGSSAFLSELGATYVLAVECGGVLFLFPALRKLYVIAATLMVLGIALLLGFHAGTWLLVLFSLTWSSPGEPRKDRRNTG